MRALLFAAAFALAGSAHAQSAPPPQPRPQGLVFHVAGAGGTAPVVSLGMVAPGGTGPARISHRREMQADCTWSQAPDISAPVDSVVPLRDPSQFGGAEPFGNYYATLFNALATAKGSAPTPTQHTCVRRTMTTLAESLIQRRAAQAARGAPDGAPTE
jgi:hypothetical protein